MTSRSHNPDVSPVRDDFERITRRSQVSAAGSPPMTDPEMIARMATTRITGIWNVTPIASRSRLSSHKKGGVDVPAIDEDNEIVMLLIDPDDVRPTHIERQRIIDSA